jgi:PAS domain S-box-containing protein
MRQNPVIDVGNIDSAVALVLCDAARPDYPIVYCSDTFADLTGYTRNEIIGKNCRFLQFPPRLVSPNQHQQAPQQQLDAATQAINDAPRAVVREKVAKGEECRVRFINFRKSGERWENLLTIVPLVWNESDTWKRYIVGFQADLKGLV